MTFTPSIYQAGAKTFLTQGSGHGFMEAVAGSGKTTTLIWLAEELSGTAYQNIIIVAFNKHIKEEIIAKLGEARDAGRLHGTVSGNTVHGLGRAILASNYQGRLPDKAQGFKYKRIAEEYLRFEGIKRGKSFSTKHALQLAKLVDFARLTLTPCTDLHALGTMAAHYDLEIDEDEREALFDGISPCIKSGVEDFQNTGVHDFTDMIFLPVYLNMTAPQYDLIMVDEAQDLNEAERATIVQCAKRARILFVGDRKQSIMGFAGADTNSVDNIVTRLQARILPLSICWRCPDLVVWYAKQLVPQIEACGREQGKVEVVDEEYIKKNVKPGDMVLCRTTAPLVSMCLRLLREGIRAQVKGKDLGTMFQNIVQKLAGRMGFSIHSLARLVEQYRIEQVRILSQREDADMLLDNMSDQVETFLALYEAYMTQAGESASIPGFSGEKGYLENFFPDNDEKGVVMLSTIHRAKGLQRPKVYILKPELLPHPMAKKRWQVEQETNLLYVAITRAQEALYFVGCLPMQLMSHEQPQEPAQAVLIVEDEPEQYHIDSLASWKWEDEPEPESIMTPAQLLQIGKEAMMQVEKSASWVQPPKANVAVKVGRKPKSDPRGRKSKSGKPRVTLQLSIDADLYEQVMRLKAAGKIESASALFEEMFKAKYN